MLNRSNNLNVIRLFAALQVVYMHAIHHLHLAPGPGLFFTAMQSFNGVLIFFVVSGFLVTDSYLNSSSVGAFGMKRALRIYPGLIANIALLEILVFATGGFSANQDLLNYVVFFTAYAGTGAQSWAGNIADSPYVGWGFFKHYPSGVLWTLTVELMFYAALPLFIEMWKRSRAGGMVYLGVATGLSLLLTYVFHDRWQTFVSLSLGPYFWIFAVGVVARLWWPRLRAAFEGRAAYWLAGHAALVLACWSSGWTNALIFSHPSAIDFVRLLLLSGVIFSVAFTAPRPDLLRGYDISYGVYLYHMLVLHTLVGLGYANSRALWLIVFGGSIGFGLLSWVAIERPIRDWKEDRRRLKPQYVTVAAPV